MKGIAEALEQAGFRTFLPQRDGLELTVCARLLVGKGFAEDEATLAVSKAIFALDVFQVIEHCQALVVNLNGRVPDEGAVSEAAMAWCAGKTLVGYKADGRSVFLGQDNPMVAGLFGFELYNSVDQVVTILQRKLLRRGAATQTIARRRAELAAYLDLGRRIWGAINGGQGVQDVAQVLSCLGHEPRVPENKLAEA
jgi:nucleoside 2-deoxyribosyltransferase